jgi:putative oxidoreductase
MLKRIFAVRPQPAFTSFALLLLRLTVGTAFAIHGWPKIQNPTGWMKEDPAPAVFQALAALSEFGGGIALVIGALTPLASFGILCTMAVAVHMHAIKKEHQFVAKEDSWELPAAYFCILLLLIATGPGKLSVDRRLFGVRGQSQP